MKFFVYIHRRASNGKVFYIGKGCRYRHKSLWNRSQHWKNIVNKHGYTIEIAQDGLTEEQAFSLEIELIKKHKNEGLCNKTIGGEGASGFVASQETKEKYKKMRWSDKWRKNLSMKAKERFADPEYRKLHIERHKKVMAREDVKEKLRNAAIKQFTSKENRERARQLTIKYFSNPEAKELARLKALERFNTPEKRANHIQAKKLRCIETNMVFGTTTLAAEWVSALRGSKADNSQISKVCRGIAKKAYGFTWEYVKKSMEVLD